MDPAAEPPANSLAGPLARPSRPSRPRHRLQICAVLVENRLNLGALCRTAEVFRLETLVLTEVAIAQDWAFRQLAASAHHWQPLTACDPALLSRWVGAQQALGYTVLALTRHPQAQCLTQLSFPVKTALILGRELTGIPPEIVAVCDGMVSIPQWGHVESLNVHTAAAIASYEYVKQHPL
jgi:tRNA G18 (ribose-2'-O)-methylase SpoU